MARIKVIQYGQAEGELKPIYDELIQKRGKLSEVLKIQSLHPVLVTAYFNYINRLVMALGVQLEEDEGAGYKY